MLLTNGEYLNGEVVELRKFKLIATHGQYYWVQALNGSYKGELLTFNSDFLKEIND